jgi:hypothetical protein
MFDTIPAKAELIDVTIPDRELAIDETIDLREEPIDDTMLDTELTKLVKPELTDETIPDKAEPTEDTTDPIALAALDTALCRKLAAFEITDEIQLAAFLTKFIALYMASRTTDLNRDARFPIPLSMFDIPLEIQFIVEDIPLKREDTPLTTAFLTQSNMPESQDMSCPRGSVRPPRAIAIASTSISMILSKGSTSIPSD